MGEGGSQRLRILCHGSEFDDCELAAVETDPPLPEQCRAGAADPHSEADRHQQRKQNQKGRRCNNPVQAGFGDATATAEDRLVNVQQRQPADRPIAIRGPVTSISAGATNKSIPNQASFQDS